jgi:hypothetical protein
MEYNTPNKPTNAPLQLDMKHNPAVSPIWAKLLYKGVTKKDKMQSKIDALRDDPSAIFKGYLGKSLLDKHINPFFDRIMPDSTKLDVLKRQFKFQPHDRFNMTVGAKGGNPKMNLNWRF